MTVALLCDYDALAPCPLCGNPVRGYWEDGRGWYPNCSCGLTSDNTLFFYDPVVMVQWWNQRAGESALKAGHAAYCADREQRIRTLEAENADLRRELVAAVKTQSGEEA